jgi:hypothetical protein
MKSSNEDEVDMLMTTTQTVHPCDGTAAKLIRR